MSSRSKKNRDMLKKRVHSLEVELASLQPSQHAYKSNKRMLESQLQLAKAELAPPKKSKTRKRRSSSATTNADTSGKSSTTTSPAPKKSKRSPLPGGASFPSFQLPSPKSPTFYEDSLKTVNNLRNMCSKAMGYLQRADQLFGGLHGVGNHLQEAGVLPKIMSGKFKDLSTGEWGTLLMALMQSPLSGMLLGGGGGAEGGEAAAQQALPEGAQTATTPQEPQANAEPASHS